MDLKFQSDGFGLGLGFMFIKWIWIWIWILFYMDLDLDYLGFKNINLPNSDINIVILENNIGIVLPKSFGDSAKVDTTAKP